MFLVFREKLFRKIRYIIVNKLRNKRYYYYIYTSYWHQILVNGKQKFSYLNYLTSQPNPGAGIGHQMSNWIAGYWFSKLFNLNYAYSPFPSDGWNSFLGFYLNETAVSELTKKRHYKIVRLPLFDENNILELNRIKKIIDSYSSKHIIFLTEQDQFYRNQFEVMNELQNKFYNADSRKKESLIFSNNYFNIAIHIRRGDIVVEKSRNDLSIKKRWLNNNYYLNIIDIILSIEHFNKPVAFYIFSEGAKNDFSDFLKYNNMNLCLDVNPINSFLNMVYADLLVTSKSSFSYKPALLSKAIKICPNNFWHSYPNEKEWIIADENGIFNVDLLKSLFL